GAWRVGPRVGARLRGGGGCAAAGCGRCWGVGWLGWEGSRVGFPAGRWGGGGECVSAGGGGAGASAGGSGAGFGAQRCSGDHGGVQRLPVSVLCEVCVRAAAGAGGALRGDRAGASGLAGLSVFGGGVGAGGGCGPRGWTPRPLLGLPRGFV